MSRVLLGVTGSVAAITTPELVADLTSAGHEVRVIATPSALYFFDAGAVPNLIRDADEWPGERYQRGDAVLHIELRRWAETLLVAPLDANTLAKFALGLADNCLSCVYRAWEPGRPIVLAPAMNTRMWDHPATHRHLRQIEADVGPACRIVPPQVKPLACADVGMGAMASRDRILAAVSARPIPTDTPLSLTRDDVRAIDRDAETRGLPTRVLMETAGRGVADVATNIRMTGRIVIVAGKGNNGGDGLVAARHLVSRGRDVRVVLVADPDQLTGPAAENWQAAIHAGVPTSVRWPFAADRFADDLSGAEWIVDALFGIGLSSPPRPPFDRVVDMINESGARVLAIDVPSGLDADTGLPLGAVVRADHTVTFVAPKKGFAHPDAGRWTGRVHVVDLGLGRPGS